MRNKITIGIGALAIVGLVVFGFYQRQQMISLGVNITVPQAPGKGYSLEGNTTGAWVASSTMTDYSGNYIATSTRTNVFPYASSTVYSSFLTASSTNYLGAGLSTCDPTTGKLTWASGQFGCGTDFNTGGAGGTWAFTPVTHFGTSTQSTSTPLWLRGSLFSLFASSTAVLTNASTTQLTIQNWYVATSTTVCIAPETCQFPVASASAAADVQINAAIDFVEGKGGKVHIKAGTYNIDAPIIISASSVELIGDGANATILKPKTNFNDYVIKVNDAARREFLAFRSFRIEGNSSNQSSGGCIMASSTARSVFDSLSLERCEVHAIKLAGDVSNNFGYNNVISNNYIADNRIGIEMVWNDENQIYGNTINSSVQYHIYDRQGLNNIHDNAFTGTVYTTGKAIYIEYTNSSSVNNNTFDNVPEEAVFVQCGGGLNGQINISGNKIYHTSSGGYGNPAIKSAGPCISNLITNNYVGSEDAENPYAYQETGTSPIGTIVQGNYFAATSSALSLGSNTTSQVFFNYATTTPASTYFWSQIDANGLFGSNVPTGKSYYWGINGTKYLTLSSLGQFGVGTTTPIADFQVASSTSNATTSIQFGKPNQNKGTCITYYDTAGTPVYGFIAAGATAFTYTGSKPAGCNN